MEQLSLPEYTFKKRKTEKNSEEIFDVFRKKWVKLTPEEWVRQNFLTWLVIDKNYPSSLLSVERSLTINKRNRRFDAVLFNTTGDARILLEFKAPEVKLSLKTVDQIAAYNSVIKASYLIISNGLTHYCIKMDYKNNNYSFLTEIPKYIKL